MVSNSSRKRMVKICANTRCKNTLTSNRKYCSLNCIPKVKSKYNSEVVIAEIQQYVNKNNRIPFKHELIKLNKPVRSFFGTWNNAILAAGYEPNPVRFAKKYTAGDGHICDSLSEEIIDNWLYARNIKHEIHLRYPGRGRFISDFKVGKYWIEFFGLKGKHSRYDKLMKNKLRLAKKLNLKLIKIYPKDLFPENNLEKVLSLIINS
jgi:hypothetical protein